MSTMYTVKEGDCLYSISAELGFLAQTLWNESSNAALKAKRKDPFVLFAGDVVHIPDKRAKSSSKESGEKHRFRKKGSSVNLRLQLLADGKPRANVAYTIEVEGILIEGVTDEQGMIDLAISPSAKAGKLLLKDTHEGFLLDLGQLNPSDEPKGIQARLQNLGLYQGAIDGEWNEETIAAIKAFQEEQNIRPSGKPDDATIEKLVERHGC